MNTMKRMSEAGQKKRSAGLADSLGKAGVNIQEAVREIERDPDLARTLEDWELLILATWSQDNPHADSHAVTEECVRRARSGSRFARYLGHDELVTILDERAR